MKTRSGNKGMMGIPDIEKEEVRGNSIVDYNHELNKNIE